MTMQRARRRGRSDFRRTPGNKPGRRILVVCEGEETEPGYFQALKQECKLGAMVVIEGRKCGSAPISVVDWALREKKQALRSHNPYDAIWCVFDRDQHESFLRAIDKARGNGLRVAFSVPSFELWVLLHFRYTTAPFGTCDQVESAIKRYYPGYDKSGMDWDCLRPHRDTAKQNAQRILAQKNSDELYPNPCTWVHELVQFLETV